MCRSSAGAVWPCRAKRLCFEPQLSPYPVQSFCACVPAASCAAPAGPVPRASPAPFPPCPRFTAQCFNVHSRRCCARRAAPGGAQNAQVARMSNRAAAVPAPSSTTSRTPHQRPSDRTLQPNKPAAWRTSPQPQSWSWWHCLGVDCGTPIARRRPGRHCRAMEPMALSRATFCTLAQLQ